jgi:hypothetical protein
MQGSSDEWDLAWQHGRGIASQAADYTLLHARQRHWNNVAAKTLRLALCVLLLPWSAALSRAVKNAPRPCVSIPQDAMDVTAPSIHCRAKRGAATAQIRSRLAAVRPPARQVQQNGGN